MRHAPIRASRSLVTLALICALALAAPRVSAQGWTVGYEIEPLDPAVLEALVFDDLAPASDGGVVFVSKPIDYRIDPPLLGRVSADGSIALAWRVMGFFPTAVGELADGSIVAAGYNEDVDRFVAVRLLPDGTLAWARAFGNGFLYVGSPDLTVDGAGRIVIAGIVIANGDGTCGIVVFDLDASGVVLRSHEIEEAADIQNCGERVDLVTTTDGIAVGLADEWGLAVVVRLDDARNITGQWRVDECEATEGLAAHADGSLDVGCLAYSSGRVHVLRLEPGGAVRWQVTLDEYSRSTKLAAGDAGTALVATVGYATSRGQVTWAASLDGASGAELWSQHLLPWWQAAEPPQIARAASGGAFVAFGRSTGAVRTFGSELARLDSTGGVAGPCSQLAPAPPVEPSSLTVLPSTHAIAPVALVPEDMPLTSAAGVVRISPICSVTSCQVDESEPDDTCGELGPLELTLTASRTANFCDDAQDWFMVRTCAGIPLVVTTSDLGPAADTVLELWSWDCSALLASDDNGGGGLASRLEHLATTTGKAWIRVVQADGTSGPGREWTVTREPDACCCTSWEITLERQRVNANILAETSSGFVFAGDDFGDPWMLRVPVAGDAVSGFTLSRGTPTWIQAVAGAGDDVIIAGNAQWPVLGTEGWVARVAPDGTVAWARTWPGSESVSHVAVLAADGTIAIAQKADAGTRRPMILLASASGDLLRAVELTEEWAIEGLVALDGGGFAVITRMAFPSPIEGRLLAFAPNGDLAWDRNFPAMGPVLIATIPGGRIAVLLGETPDAYHVVALEQDGSLAWSRLLDATMWPPSVMGSMADGTLILAETGGPPEIVALDPSTGDVLWATHAGPVFGTAWSSELLPLQRHAGILGTWGSTLSLRDTTGEIRGPCDNNRVPFSYVTAPSSATIASSAPVLADVTLAWTAGTLEVTPQSVAWSRTCGDSACPPLVVVVDAPATSCVGASVALSAHRQGGCRETWMTGTYEWDLDWDGVTFDVDTNGPEIAWTFPGGSVTVAARFTSAEPPFDSAIGVATIIEGGSAEGIAGSATRCADDPCTLLEAPPASSAWTWSTGETTSSICVSPAATTTYSLVATDAVGCAIDDTHLLEVFPLPVIDFTQTCGAGVALVEALVSDCPGCALLWSSGETTARIEVPYGELRTVTATSSSGCTSSADVTAITCFAPGEVGRNMTYGGPGPGLPGGIVLQQVAGATAYNVLGNALGNWSAAGAPACHLRTWTDLGGGAIALDADASVQPNTWFVVTASNAAAEGDAGAGTDGVERSQRAGWVGCGAAP